MSEIYCCKKCEQLFDEDTLYFLGSLEETKRDFPDAQFPTALCYNHMDGSEGSAYKRFAHIKRRESIISWNNFSKMDLLFKTNKEHFLRGLFSGDVNNVNSYAASRLEVEADKLVEKTQGKSNISFLFLKKSNNHTIEDSKNLQSNINAYIDKNKIVSFCDILGPGASVALLVPEIIVNPLVLYSNLQKNLELIGTLHSYHPNYKIKDLLEQYNQKRLEEEDANVLDEILRDAKAS